MDDQLTVVESPMKTKQSLGRELLNVINTPFHEALDGELRSGPSIAGQLEATARDGK